ncbi:hypothetical protein FRY97_17980 [Phaeodactylibacter luteus]|uniref:Uncharacterized protein n=1 Tax=Phaeodactylibacter luteus TaxID=1564516 RepID=A0A5C6RH75_9BACT|nr:hypothetical protein FRY97_17980 [Phaeodactylibacter luteus]
MLRGSLSARPLALQASGLAFGHPCAALGQRQAIKPEKHKRLPHFGLRPLSSAGRNSTGLLMFYIVPGTI